MYPWVYCGITEAQQLSTWHGRQTLNDSCYLGQHVWMYPQEYIAYGAESVHAIELTPSNNKRYKFTDHLGTTRLVVNDRNALVTQRDTKPFGGELFLFGVDTRKGFIDKETDTESGLSDFSARKYDNDLGLFTRPDKFWERYRELSPYSYSANSPLRLIDPSGDTNAVYDRDGNFVEYRDLDKSGMSGILQVNDNFTIEFEFHNIDQDRQYIENGIVVFSAGTLKSLVEKSTNSMMDDLCKLCSILDQSTPAPDEDGDGYSDANHATEGLLDFAPELRLVLGVGKEQKLALVLPAPSLAKSSEISMAYDRFELGNFLWGASGSRLGQDLGVLLTGAQLNNVLNGRRQNPGDGVGFLDDPFDQNAIIRGFEYFIW